jgi:integrase/recombinase XerD
MWISCLRVSEAVAIQFEDIEAGQRSIRITKAKGNYPRLAFMDRYTFTALNRYLDEERRDLFPKVPEVFVAFKGTARGRPLTVNAVQKMVRYYGQQCELAGLHPHLFRHAGITQLVQQKMPEPAIRQLVGHHRPESLLPYLHLGDDFVATEFERAQAGLSVTQRLQPPAGGGA